MTQAPPTPAADTDEALAARGRDGCADSIEALVRRFQVPVLRYLQRRGCREAEDVAQETFLRAVRSLHTFRDGRPFAPWLFTIAHRLSIDAVRRGPRLPDARESTPSADPAIDAERAESAERLWATVRQALGDTDAFAAVWLHYVEGLDDREVAAVLDRSWTWVRTTLHRAKRQLAVVLAEDG